MFKFNLVLITTFLLPNLSYSELDLQVLHTKPECNYEGHSSAWCELDDRGDAEKRAGMVDKIKAMIDLADNSESKIAIAYFSFSNKSVFNKLCNKGKEGILIEGFFDSDYSEPNQFPSKLQKECRGPEGNNIKIRFLGKKEKNEDGELVEWRLHHNKFLIVNPGQKRDVSISFSSGNLSTFGTSLHFDHWVTTMAPSDSQFYKSHKCILEGLRTAVDDSTLERDDPSLYIETFESCNNSSLPTQNALNEDGIYLVNAPNNDQRAEKALLKEIDRISKLASENEGNSYEIFGAIQHFSHWKIASALNKLCSKTYGRVNVNMIMDDDVINGDSEVPGVDDFFIANLLNTENGGNSCINITFMETNSSIRQMMHNKFIVFTGPNYFRSFSGAGHFTYSAMRNNYENFYVSNSQSLVSQYLDLYDYMNKNSLTYSEVSGE